MTCWYEMLKETMEADGEDFEKRVCTMDESELRREFENHYGDHDGRAFTAWGERWVYFPICYDGTQWVGHAPRNPCDIAMEPQGR